MLPSDFPTDCCLTVIRWRVSACSCPPWPSSRASRIPPWVEPTWRCWLSVFRQAPGCGDLRPVNHHKFIHPEGWINESTNLGVMAGESRWLWQTIGNWLATGGAGSRLLCCRVTSSQASLRIPLWDHVEQKPIPTVLPQHLRLPTAPVPG